MFAFAAALMFAPVSPGSTRLPAPSIRVTLSAAAGRSPVTGRLIIAVSPDSSPEPRMLISPSGPAIFAIDVSGWNPGDSQVIDSTSLGYPSQLDGLAEGDYWIQPLVDVYQQVHRSDGRTIWVHFNDGAQEVVQIAAGNLYGDPVKVHIARGAVIAVTVSHVIEAPPRDSDTQWIKHVRIRSDRLTAFWGRPVYINATVLLPVGYADHPAQRYPVVFTMGHDVPFGFDVDSAGVRGIGTINPISGLETGYDFYKEWTAADFPRVIAVSFQQQTPYFPDSYSVNSANNGPYGDAMVDEVIPALEEQFRMIAKPYARQLEGASTGGWQTLALQLQHPDFFGGAWVLQPDPIDFHRYQLVDIYSDTNAFVLPVGPFNTTERPFRRTTAGQVVWTERQLSRFEAVLGSHGRSGYQLEAWEAVYGPVGSDGYPRPLWNKLTGSIDTTVADYMRDHDFDLCDYAQRNWSTLGPKLAGKLHFFAGDMDDFYLDLAVYRMQDFLTGVGSDATFTFGRPMKGHGWHAQTWGELVRRVAAAVAAAR
ncbi:MAG: hypothetical protein ACREL5_08040 [Gemmatimonadales bacterium]